MPAQTASPPGTGPPPSNGPARSPPGAARPHRPVLRTPITRVLRSRITQLGRAIRGTGAPQHGGHAWPAGSGAGQEGQQSS
jgi:hypothetical protein